MREHQSCMHEHMTRPNSYVYTNNSPHHHQQNHHHLAYMHSPTISQSITYMYSPTISQSINIYVFTNNITINQQHHIISHNPNKGENTSY